MLDRWTAAVLRHRAAVLIAWAGVVVVGLVAAAGLSGLLTTSLTVPGSPSAAANVILGRHFHDNVEGSFTVVVPVGAHSPARLRDVERRVAAAARAVPTASVAQERAAFGLLYVSVDTRLTLSAAAAATGSLRHALTGAGVAGALVTGPPALQHDVTPVLHQDLRRGEVLALALALVLLLALLGVTWAVAVPFVVAAAASSAALIAVWLLAHWLLMVLYVPNVVVLVGLGLAVDYSLLMVHRFRAELARDDRVDAAVARTVATAGRTVVISGVAVALGLASLLAVPVPFLRSLGAAGLVVPLASVAAALTLQPVLLSLLGRRVRPRALRGVLSPRDPLTGAWARVADQVLRRPNVTLVVSSLALVAASTTALWLQVTPGSLTAVPHDLPSARAIALVRSRVGSAVITPIELVIDTGGPGRVDDPAQRAARLALAESILRDGEVSDVAIGRRPPYVDATGRFARVLVVNRHDFGAEATQGLVHRLRAAIIPRVRFPAGTSITVGGAPGQGVDFLNAVYGALPWILAAVFALAYLVLVRAFRSALLPLVAVVLDLASVLAAWGLTVAVFRFGVGASWLGVYRVDQLEGWVPVFIFAVLFGLSSDYEVFIVARMRESYDAGAGTREAIRDGLARTGGVVTAAAVVMVAALSGLVAGRVAGLQELGVGLSIGVLLDATLIRGLVLPSVMARLGRFNWWLPGGLARVVRATASPLAQRGTRP
ncbi:MAG: MMPL family transporter [Acidimicrobiales bacterium]